MGGGELGKFAECLLLKLDLFRVRYISPVVVEGILSPPTNFVALQSSVASGLFQFLFPSNSVLLNSLRYDACRLFNYLNENENKNDSV